MNGIRVLEVASWVMAPTAGAVLADWGADVIKVEHPERGDPGRGLRHLGIVETGKPLNVSVHHANRNKRSIGLDISTPRGHEILMELVDVVDVFLTNFLPALRQRLGIDVEHIRDRNPRVVYARGSAVGPRGPQRERSGYDFATFWCRTGLSHALQRAGESHPPVMPSGAMGDITTGAFLAGAISAALLQREREGVASVVDGSLLATGAWLMAMNVAPAAGDEPLRLLSRMDRESPNNPLVNVFRTSDDRYLATCLLQADWAWPELCERLGRADLLADERFADAAGLQAHATELTAILDEVFATRTLAEWQDALAGTRGVWETVQNMSEVAHDPQVVANGYVQAVVGATDVDGAPAHLVSAPTQFDEASPTLVVAPEVGQHTEDVLLALGYDWDAIVGLKEDGVIT